MGDTLEEFLLENTQDPKLRQLMMSMSEAIRTIAYKVRRRGGRCGGGVRRAGSQRVKGEGGGSWGRRKMGVLAARCRQPEKPHLLARNPPRGEQAAAGAGGRLGADIAGARSPPRPCPAAGEAPKQITPPPSRPRQVRTASCSGTACVNSFGDEQLAVDMLADKLLFEALKYSGVCKYAVSEEVPEPVDLKGGYGRAGGCWWVGGRW